ncbi:MAG: cyclophilin-like fold protein [Methanomassiliicoccales archaeon]
MKKVLMKTPALNMEIELNETDTADALFMALPVESQINVWGKEIYFEVDLDQELENPREIMEVGEVAYWPQGKAFCLFFGPTPVSQDHRPRAVGEVTPLGRVLGDPAELEGIGDRSPVTLTRA